MNIFQVYFSLQISCLVTYIMPRVKRNRNQRKGNNSSDVADASLQQHNAAVYKCQRAILEELKCREESAARAQALVGPPRFEFGREVMIVLPRVGDLLAAWENLPPVYVELPPITH